MSVIVTDNGNLGPFKLIEVREDRLCADGVDYPFATIGAYQISEDNSLAPLPPAPPADQIIADLTKALEDYYDERAKERRYDNRYTCTLRAGYVGPFQAEGVAFATWMDTCNAYGYQVMADVLAGNRGIPTAAELIAELPELVWPL